jgi:hypothetical protein
VSDASPSRSRCRFAIGDGIAAIDEQSLAISIGGEAEVIRVVTA